MKKKEKRISIVSNNKTGTYNRKGCITDTSDLIIYIMQSI